MDKPVSSVKPISDSLQRQLKEVSDSLLSFSASRTEAENLRVQLKDLLQRLEENQ
ncbi:hypothetical protein [Alteromonas facilis]|uniref:hypothetical protein n=1 Tax=Alteromonas facilis TaxID=2048004 RepID=UPI0013DACE59|nr:hypothetical protein [Alteromonas facilis]